MSQNYFDFDAIENHIDINPANRKLHQPIIFIRFNIIQLDLNLRSTDKTKEYKNIQNIQRLFKLYQCIFTYIKAKLKFPYI